MVLTKMFASSRSIVPVGSLSNLTESNLAQRDGHAGNQVMPMHVEREEEMVDLSDDGSAGNLADEDEPRPFLMEAPRPEERGEQLPPRAQDYAPAKTKGAKKEGEGSVGKNSEAMSHGRKSHRSVARSSHAGSDAGVMLLFEEHWERLRESPARMWFYIVWQMLLTGGNFLLKKRRNEMFVSMQSMLSLFQMFVLPYQTAFDLQVRFDALYLLAYMVDLLQLGFVLAEWRSMLPLSARFWLDRRVCACYSHALREWQQKQRRNHDQSLEEDEAKLLSYDTLSGLVFPTLIVFLTVPYDLFIWMATGDLLWKVRNLRLMPAAVQLHVAMITLQSSQILPFKTSRSLHLVLLLVLATHIIGCCFFLFARLDDAQHFSGTPWATQSNITDLGGGIHYLRTVYWALATLLTVGHVDTVNEQGEPDGAAPWEFLGAIVIMIGAMITYLFLTSNITSMMLAFFSEMESYRTRVSTLDKFLRKQRVDPRLRVAIYKHFSSTQSRGAKAAKILDTLPVSLKREVLKSMHMRVLIRCPEVLELDKSFLAQVCNVLETQHFEVGEELCSQGDVMHEFYFLASGKVQSVIEPPPDGVESDDLDDLQYELREKERAVLRKTRVLREPGAALAIYAFLFGLRQEASIRALGQTHCLMLTRASYKALAQEFPREVFKLREKTLALTRALYGDEATANVSVSGGLDDIAQKQGSQLNEMFAAAEEGNEQRLRAVLDPQSTATTIHVDAVDGEQRTALHIAAGRDKKEAVALLLELGATTSLRDGDGRTPLAVAIGRNHNATARQLRSSGASLGWDEAMTAGELCEAVKTGNLDRLDLLLFCGASANALDYDRRSALHVGACVGNKRAVQALVRKGVNVNAVDRWGGTPTWDAVREQHRECAVLLYEAGGRLLFDSARCAHELGDATRSSNAKLVELMIECGADPNSTNSLGRTCFHVAASAGDLSMVTILLAAAANVNVQDNEGVTPLALAIRNGHTELARKMIESGAKVLYDEMTAASELCEFAKQGKIERLQLLLSAGCDPGSAAYNKRTALHLACSVGNMMAVQMFVQSNADVNCVDSWGNSPVFEAVRNGHLEVVRFCIQHGAVLDIAQGASELCELARGGDVEKIRAMLQAKIDPNSADYDRRVCLHLAASTGNVLICELLLDAGADINFQDRWGGTPLSDAVREGHGKLVSVLRERGAELQYDEPKAAAELIQFTLNGDLERVKMLAISGVNLDSADQDGRTGLHVAASVGNKLIVNTFVEYKANVNAQDRAGHGPLVAAVQGGHRDIALHLIEHGAVLGFDELTAAKALCEMGRTGDLEQLKLLVAGDCDPNLADEDQRTCLHLAATVGNLKVVEYLCESTDANINAMDRWGGTPLAEAVREGHAKVVELLLESKAELNFDEAKMSGELCELARAGDVERVKLLLSCGIDANAADYDKRTCLHLASSVGNLRVVQALVGYSANVNFADRWGGTALGDAVREGHREVANLLIEHGAILGYDDATASEALTELARGGDLDKVKLLLLGKCNPDVKDYDKRSCLHLAATTGNVHVVEALLDAGASINCVDRWGVTPLADAVREGHNKLATMLHERGGELMYDDSKAAAELCSLASIGDIERLQLMLQCGVSVDAADYDNRSCIHVASSMGNVRVIEALIAHSSNTCLRDRWGRTPLAEAVREGHAKVVAVLLASKAELNFDEAKMSGELCELARAGDVERVQLLLSCGIDANAADYDKRTCLHLASSVGNLRVVQALLDHSVDVNFADRWGGTALGDAVREGHREVANLLIEHGAILGYDDATASEALTELARGGDLDKVKLLLLGKCNPDVTDYDKRSCLNLAATTGNVHVVEALLDAGASINCVDRWGVTPLADAVREGHNKLATMLHERGGELMYDEESMAKVLCKRARHGDLNGLEVLVQVGCSVNSTGTDGRSCLHAAAVAGNRILTLRLIELGARMDVRDKYGVTPLALAVREAARTVALALVERGAELKYDKATAAHELCAMARTGDVEGIRLLVIGGADVNAADYDGRTCLHVAAFHGNLAVVQILFKLRKEQLEPSPVDRWGGTPLSDALQENHLRVAELLFEHKAVLSCQDDLASLKLSTHARNGELEQMRALIKYGYSVKCKDYDSRTALHAAAGENNLHIVQLVLREGADVNVTDWHGHTPLDEAVARENTKIAQVLRLNGAKRGEQHSPSELGHVVRTGRLDKLEEFVQNGCDVNAKDDDGRTALHLAAGYGYLHLVEYLVRQAGADTNIKDPRGATALSYAQLGGHEHVVALLAGEEVNTRAMQVMMSPIPANKPYDPYMPTPVRGVKSQAHFAHSKGNGYHKDDIPTIGSFSNGAPNGVHNHDVGHDVPHGNGVHVSPAAQDL